MPREFVAIPTALWREPSFAGMPFGAQRMYLLLCSQRNLSQAGHLPLTPRRWAGLAADATTNGVLADLAALEAAGWAWIDHDDQEVLLRPHTAPAGHKRLQGALQATLSLQSPRLQGIATSALLDLGHDGHGHKRMSLNDAFTQMRLRVHVRDGFACLQCGWAPNVPDGYDGRYALGSVYFDEAALQYRVRILELDHVYPDFLGGKFTFDNLQTLCNSCNARKGARV